MSFPMDRKCAAIARRSVICSYAAGSHTCRRKKEEMREGESERHGDRGKGQKLPEIDAQEAGQKEREKARGR